MNSLLEASSSVAPAKWEPEHHSVPRTSISPVSEISLVARLIGYTEVYWPQEKKSVQDGDLARKGNGLQNLLKTLQTTTGIDIYQLDPALLLRRLAWRMRLNGVDDLATYESVLANNPAELPALRKSLLIRVTDFFRDPNVYFELERSVIPKLLKSAGKDGARILVTGCGTGEEAYSLAMLIEAVKKRSRLKTQVRILGNDEDKNALNQARRGYYPHLVTADLSPFCLDHFFEATEDGYRINEKIRNSVRFIHSETDDASSFSDLDLLVCRNPLLFRNGQMQQRLIQAFHSRLQKGGYLVLEPTVRSEVLDTLFQAVDSHHGVYQRRDDAASSQLLGKEERGVSSAALSRLGRGVNEQPELARYLEEELFQLKEKLRLTISEYETAHKDLIDQNHALQTDLRRALLERDQAQAELDGFKDMEDGVLRINKNLKQENDRLVNAYERLENVIAHSGIGFLFLNDELGIEMFTPGAGSLFNLFRADIGRPISTVESPFRWDIAKAAESVSRSQTSIERKEHSRTDRWYKIRVQPCSFDANKNGIVCTFVDVTDQHRASEWDRFKADVLNQMQDAVVVTNRDLQVTYLNKAAIEQYNLFNKKTTGCRLDELFQSVWKDGGERDRAYKILAEKGHWAGEHHHIQADGREMRVESSIHVLRDQAGEEMGMLMVVRDIGFREKDSSEFLKRLIADLEKKNEAIDKKLKKDAQRLEERKDAH